MARLGRRRGRHPAAVSYPVPQGPVAAALAVPWLLFALGVAQFAAWLQQRSWRIDALAPLAAAGFLGFAAIWLVLDRAGAEVLGVGPPLVQLTS
ncbi:MAG: YndJ family transporter, partial [Actinobacteria bacterium]|nr:YndJ family transporter [Actinomycetota bacterium]MCA1722640.1 YndJ family transporter [Actinomycetota bacterium]